MKSCDRCGIKINPDNEGFEGTFFEFNDGAQVDICDSCTAEFSFVWRKFLNSKVQ